MSPSVGNKRLVRVAGTCTDLSVVTQQLRRKTHLIHSSIVDDCRIERYCTLMDVIGEFTGGPSIRANWPKLINASGNIAECRPVNRRMMETAIHNIIRNAIQNTRTDVDREHASNLALVRTNCRHIQIVLLETTHILLLIQTACCIQTTVVQTIVFNNDWRWNPFTNDFRISRGREQTKRETVPLDAGVEIMRKYWHKNPPIQRCRA